MYQSRVHASGNQIIADGVDQVKRSAIDNRVAVVYQPVPVDVRVAGVDDRKARINDRVAKVDDRVAWFDNRVVRVDDRVTTATHWHPVSRVVDDRVMPKLMPVSPMRGVTSLRAINGAQIIFTQAKTQA